jgi:penicillin-binding protein 1C
VATGTIILIWLFCLPDKLFQDPTSTVVYDRNGNLLGASISEDGQWRFPHNPIVPYKFKMSIIQFEDRGFESHWGISIKGLVRAAWQNVSSGEKVSGASTITMQVMRMSRKGQDRNIWQKVIEIFWATRAEWRYSKDEILALYASNAPMGGNVVGLDAAAWRYFGRPADQLTWAESATLAVLPNAPSLIHPGRNRDQLLEKRNRLLDRLFEVGLIDSSELSLSKFEPLPDQPHDIPKIAPQLMTRIIRDGRKGQVVHSTIDVTAQERVNSIVKTHHIKLSENEIHNAAVLVMEVETGDVIAYTGNVPDGDPEHGCDVDVIMSRRSTGSILKPFLYAGMLESGEITPSMLVQDIPTVMSGYSPKNYNLRYDGVIPADEALAKSLNVPLVRMLTKFGVEKFRYLLKQLKFDSIDKSAEHYGLSLILGGAEVTLWDLVSAYGMMARCLNRYPNYGQGINKKAHYLKGDVNTERENPVLGAASCWFTFEAMKEVARPEDDINWEMFSTSQKVAWKTGTSFGFRDAWAVGCTPKFVVGVWVGNADGEGRPGLIGREAAAPLLFDVISALPQSEWFKKPYQDMKEVDICVKSGCRAGEHCDNVDKRLIPESSLNTVSCPYHKQLFLDQSGQFQVNSSCYDMSLAQARNWFVLPAVAEYFYKSHDPNYVSPPPFSPQCGEQGSGEELAILYPRDNSEIFVPTNFKETKEKIVFEATHIQSGMKLFWHIDDTYLGETENIHQKEFTPEPGTHTLTVMDEAGRSAVVTFDVIGKN